MGDVCVVGGYIRCEVCGTNLMVTFYFKVFVIAIILRTLYTIDRMYRVQHKIQLYWVCESCKVSHKWPQERARKYCSTKCLNIAYYQRTKRAMNPNCSIAGCEQSRDDGFYCNEHEILPADYGVTQKRHIPLYPIWINMLQRCYNPKSQSYRYYGARGISVCEEWRHSFKSFHDYMMPRPTAKHSIDRVDNDSNYEPGNVRWATSNVQLRNRRTND